MNLVPKQVRDGVRNQAVNFPLMASVDEVWILETIGYQPGGHFLFELNDDNDRHLATMAARGLGAVRVYLDCATCDCIGPLRTARTGFDSR